MSFLDIVEKYDRQSQNKLNSVNKQIHRQSLSAYKSIEANVSRAYANLKDVTPEQAQAIISEHIRDKPLTRSTSLIKGLYKAQSQIADKMAGEYIKKLSREDKNLRSELILSTTRDSNRRISTHQKTFEDKSLDIVRRAYKQGWSQSKLRSAIRYEYGSYSKKIERITRTESATLLNKQLNEKYAASGFDYIKRVSREDIRVCAFCADKAGKIYKIADAPTVIHPNDRCYNTPWSVQDYLKKDTEDAGVEENAQETRSKALSINKELTNFQLSEGQSQKRGINVVREGLSAFSIEDRIAYDRTIHKNFKSVPLTPPQVTANAKSISWLQAAIFAGLTVGAVVCLVRRKKNSQKLFSGQAEQLAETKQVSGNNVFSPKESKVVNVQKASEPELVTEHSQELIKHTLENHIVNGYSAEAVELASEAIAYYKKNRDKEIILTGDSKNAIIIEEVADLLDTIEIPYKLITFSVPNTGFFNRRKNALRVGRKNSNNLFDVAPPDPRDAIVLVEDNEYNLQSILDGRGETVPFEDAMGRWDEARKKTLDYPLNTKIEEALSLSIDAELDQVSEAYKSLESLSDKQDEEIDTAANETDLIKKADELIESYIEEEASYRASTLEGLVTKDLMQKRKSIVNFIDHVFSDKGNTDENISSYVEEALDVYATEESRDTLTRIVRRLISFVKQVRGIPLAQHPKEL